MSCAISIFGCALYEDGREIFRDAHEGWTGYVNRDRTYWLHLEQWREGASYELRSEIRGEGGRDSLGSIRMRKLRSVEAESP